MARGHVVCQKHDGNCNPLGGSIRTTLSNAKTRAFGDSVTYHRLPEAQEINFWECDWTDFYEDASEAISPNAPPPRRKEVDL